MAMVYSRSLATLGSPTSNDDLPAQPPREPFFKACRMSDCRRLILLRSHDRLSLAWASCVCGSNRFGPVGSRKVRDALMAAFKMGGMQAADAIWPELDARPLARLKTRGASPWCRPR